MIKEFCEIVGIKDAVLKSRSRQQDVVNARMMLYFLLRNEGWGVTEIGREFNRTHGSVINALNKLKNAIETKDRLIVPLFNKVIAADIRMQKLDPLSYEEKGSNFGSYTFILTIDRPFFTTIGVY